MPKKSRPKPKPDRWYHISHDEREGPSIDIDVCPWPGGMLVKTTSWLPQGQSEALCFVPARADTVIELINNRDYPGDVIREFLEGEWDEEDT